VGRMRGGVGGRGVKGGGETGWGERGSGGGRGGGGGGGGGVGELDESKQVVGLFVPELLLLLGSVEFRLQQGSMMARQEMDG